MTTNELRELRHQFRSAYTAYMSSVHALSDASEQSLRPNDLVFEAESDALGALTGARDVFVDALMRR